MEYRAGCDLTPSSGEAEARDTLNTVLVCLSLLLFTLLLSCRLPGSGGRACLRTPEEGRFWRSAACAAPLAHWSCRRWPSFSSWRWRPGEACRIPEEPPAAPPGSMFGPPFWYWRPRCCGTGT